MRREATVGIGLCLVGAALVLLATGRTWFEVDVRSALLGGRTVEVAGSVLAPGLPALGLVALAGVVAVAATRSWGRVLVGVVLVLVGVGVVALVIGVLRDAYTAVQDSQPVRDAGGLQGESVDARDGLWPYACALGGLIVTTAGVLVAARGRRWPALGRRYAAPATAAEPAAVEQAPGPVAGPVAERELWEALDRGDDPTAR